MTEVGIFGETRYKKRKVKYDQNREKTAETGVEIGADSGLEKEVKWHGERQDAAQSVPNAIGIQSAAIAGDPQESEG